MVKIQNASGDAVQYIDLPAQGEQQDPCSGPLQSEGGEEANELTEITRTCPELGGGQTMRQDSIMIMGGTQTQSLTHDSNSTQT